MRGKLERFYLRKAEEERKTETEMEGKIRDILIIANILAQKGALEIEN